MQLMNESVTAMPPPIPMLTVVLLQQRERNLVSSEPQLLCLAADRRSFFRRCTLSLLQPVSVCTCLLVTKPVDAKL